jgi:hypothetical protein
MALEKNKLYTYALIGWFIFTVFLLILNKKTGYGEDTFEYYTPDSKKKSVK